MVDNSEDSQAIDTHATPIDHGRPTTIWRAYDNYVRNLFGVETAASRVFAEKGLYFGQLSLELAERAAGVICSAEPEVFIAADFQPGYVTCDFPAEIVNSLNKTSSYRAFDVRHSWVIGDVLDEIKAEVAACLGSPWKTLNVRAWSTRLQAETSGPYEWHSDGFVPEIFKVMIYFNPLTPETGAIEFKVNGKTLQHRSESPGAWALFKNSEIIHRGVPGTAKERLAVEITLCRSAAYDIRCRYPGQNAHWPLFPWVDILEGSTSREAQQLENVSTKCPQVFTTLINKQPVPIAQNDGSKTTWLLKRLKLTVKQKLGFLPFCELCL